MTFYSQNLYPPISAVEVPQLTLKNIEQLLELSQEHIETVKNILKDISDPATRARLLVQSNYYKTSVDILLKELARRNSN